MNLIKHIPNSITCANLVCGYLGIIQVFENKWQNAALFVIAACIFDFFDGFAARLLKVQSAIGKELDSLADVVSFGVLPGLLFYKLINFDFNSASSHFHYLSISALLIPVLSAVRLAKFNLDTRQTDRFIGLPTPANAIFLTSLTFFLNEPIVIDFFISQQFLGQLILAIIGVICSLLLVAEIPLIALKFKNFALKGNEYRYLIVAFSALMLLILQTQALSIIILGYLVMSVIENFRTKHSIISE